MTQISEHLQIVAGDHAVGILPVAHGKPITVIGTDAIRAGFDERCLQQAMNSPLAPASPTWC